MIKKVGSCFYVHKSNRFELFNKVGNPKLRLKVLGMDGLYNYQIIKYNKSKQTVTLIQSDDWYSANEPTVGNGLIFDLTTDDMECIDYKARKNNPQIYHHKWMFMSDDWGGAAQSKKRTELLNSIPSFHTKEVKSKCGNKNYWIQWCKENNIEI